MLKRHKEKSEEETTKEQIEASVELSETKSDEADFFEEATAAVSNNFVRYILQVLCSIKQASWFLLSQETETVEGVDETPEFSKVPLLFLIISGLYLTNTLGC